MATQALTRRAKAQAASRAARARREKLGLGAGILLLVLLLALEGPKTLKSLRGTSPAPTPASTTQTTGPRAAAATTSTANRLKALSKLDARDVFVQQLGGSGTKSPSATRATPPPVRTSHFVEKDPFVQQLTVAPAAATPVTTVKAGEVPVPPLSTVGSGYVVIVASVPVAQGQPAAEKAAARVETRGVPHVRVALSSAYKSLRSGFYAVYTGPYPSLAAALKALGSVRHAGYGSAYTRRLGR